MRKMCKVLGLAESAYYQWLRRLENQMEKRKEEQNLADYLRKIFEENRMTYGYRRMHRAVLKKQDELRKSDGLIPEFLNKDISEYKVRRLMQCNGMFPITWAKFKVYRKGKSDGRFLTNILNQEFNVKRPNEMWAGDITYIRTVLGWVYLAVVVDLFNREVIGYRVSKTLDVELVKRALVDALVKTNGGGENTVFHSDRGIQYASKSFQKMLEENHIEGSMSKSGCPYDNACVESFFSTAKRECIYRKEYVTMEEVEIDLFEYIELFYNRKRMHGSLGYMSPIEYRQKKAA